MPRYELVEGSSSKFWEITLAGSSFTVRWGRIGTEGQSKAQAFGSPAEAKAAHDKLVAEKTKKGYVLAKGSAPPTPRAKAGTEAKTKTDAKAKAKAKADEDEGTPAPKAKAKGAAAKAGKPKAGGDAQPGDAKSAATGGALAPLDAKTKAKVEALIAKAEEVWTDSEKRALKYVRDALALLANTADPIRQVAETGELRYLEFLDRTDEARDAAARALARWAEVGARDGDNFVDGTWEELGRQLEKLEVAIPASLLPRVKRLWAESQLETAYLTRATSDGTPVREVKKGTPEDDVEHGRIALWQGKYDEAIALVARARKRPTWPTGREADLIVIAAKFAAGDRAGAIADWKAAIARWLKEPAAEGRALQHLMPELVALAIVHEIDEPQAYRQLIDGWIERAEGYIPGVPTNLLGLT